MALPAATGFTATVDSTTNTNVNLAWDRPNGLPANARTVIRQGGRTIYTTTDATEETYTVVGLTPGTNPSFTVHFEIASSPQVSDSEMIPLPSVPAAHAAVSEDTINLTWQRPSNLPRDTNVVIKRGDVPAKAVTIHRSSTTTSYVDRDNISSGQTYNYHFHFELGDIDGAVSPAVTIAVP